MEFEVLKRVQTLFAPSVPSSSDFAITLLNQPNEKLINVNNGLIIIINPNPNKFQSIGCSSSEGHVLAK